MLRDPIVIGGVETLAKLCNQHNVILYASELESVEKGACIGFGSSEYETGRVAGQMAYKVLVQGVIPSSLPIKDLAYNFQFCVNQQALDKQAVNLDPHVRFLMSKTLVV